MNKMWRGALLGGAMVFLLLAGCQTIPFGGPVAEERVFAVSPEVTFTTVKTMLEEEGYRTRAAAPATGRLEALSAIRTDSSFRQAVQRRIRVTVTEEGRDRSRVAVLGTLLEEVDGPASARATYERALPGNDYKHFFEELERRLGAVMEAGE